MKLLEGKLTLNEEQVKFTELDEQPRIKARKPIKEGVYSDCEREIAQLEKQLKVLKSRLKRASSEEDIDKISSDIDAKEERIGDLRGQQAEIRYLDNGNASDYSGFESLEEGKRRKDVNQVILDGGVNISDDEIMDILCLSDDMLGKRGSKQQKTKRGYCQDFRELLKKGYNKYDIYDCGDSLLNEFEEDEIVDKSSSGDLVVAIHKDDYDESLKEGKRNSDEIKVYCYTKEPEIFTNRRDAIRKYKEGILCSEGSEKERYTNVLMDLLDGFNICWDGDVVLPKDVEREYDAQYMNESCNRKAKKSIKEAKGNKVNYNVDDKGVLHIYLGRNKLLADVDDCAEMNDKELKDLVDSTLSGLGYDWKEDGTISKFDESLKEAKKDDKKSSKKDTKKKDKKEKEDEEDNDIEAEIFADGEMVGFDAKDLPDVDVDGMLSLDDIDIDADAPIIDDEVEVIPDDIETSAKSMSISDVVRNEFDSIDAIKGVIATLTLTNDDISEEDGNVIDILNSVVDLKLETIGMLNKALEVVDGDAVASMLDGEEKAEDIIDGEEEITVEDDIEDIFGGGQELEVSDKFDIERDNKEKGLFDLDDIDALPDEEEDSDIIIKDKK